jgi:hypothetical protein
MAAINKTLLNRLKYGTLGLTAMFLSTTMANAQNKKPVQDKVKTETVTVAQEQKNILGSLEKYIGNEDYQRLKGAGFKEFNVSIDNESVEDSQMIVISGKKDYAVSANGINFANYEVILSNKGKSTTPNPKSLVELKRSYMLTAVDVPDNGNKTGVSFKVEKDDAGNTVFRIEQSGQDGDNIRAATIEENVKAGDEATQRFNKLRDIIIPTAAGADFVNTKYFVKHLLSEFSKENQKSWDAQLKNKTKAPKVVQPDAAHALVDYSKINKGNNREKYALSLGKVQERVIAKDLLRMEKAGKFQTAYVRIEGDAKPDAPPPQAVFTLEKIYESVLNGHKVKQVIRDIKTVPDDKLDGNFDEKAYDSYSILDEIKDDNLGNSHGTYADIVNDKAGVHVTTGSFIYYQGVRTNSVDYKIDVEDKDGVLKVNGKDIKNGNIEAGGKEALFSETIEDIVWNIKQLAEPTGKFPVGWGAQFRKAKVDVTGEAKADVSGKTPAASNTPGKN